MSALPAPFADLEPFTETWCLSTEPERYNQRLASTVEDMQAFYNAVVPRAEEAMSYLEQLPLDSLPEDALNLLHLLYSMVMVSFPVEAFGQPRIPDTGVAYLACLVEPRP